MIEEYYTPYDSMATHRPLFQRERRRLRIRLVSDTMRQYSLELATIIGVLQIVSLISLWTAIRELLVVYWLLYFGLNLMADMYMIMVAVNLWHSRTANEQWDVMRLAYQSDEEVVHTYASLAQLQVWRVMHLNATLHMALVILAAPILLFLLPGALMAIVGVVGAPSTFSNWFPYLTLYVSVWGFLVVFIHEPIWMLQTLPLLGIVMAARYRDTNTAIGLGTAIAVAIRFGTVVVTVVALLLLFSRTLWSVAFGIALIWISIYAERWLRRLSNVTRRYLSQIAVEMMGR
jgi:hypothetical protein